MWPFKKSRYVLASVAGTVDSIMCDHITIDGVRHDCDAPMVELGRRVAKKQVVGKNSP